MRSRGGTLVLAGVLLTLAALSARMLLLAHEELGVARAAAAAGDAEAQARHLRRAMAHYLPGNPWVSAAAGELAALARAQEAGGDRDAALQSWRELRTAALVLRTGWMQPLSTELSEANDRIAALNGGAVSRARLGAPRDPSTGWVVVALAGLGVWLAGAVLLLLRGLKSDLTLVRRRFWPLLGVVATGWVLFALGLGLA